MSFIHPLVRGPLQSLQSLKNEKERYVTMAVEKLSSMQRLNPQFLQQIRDRKSAIVSNVLDGKEPSHGIDSWRAKRTQCLIMSIIEICVGMYTHLI